ncbi:MAG: MBL fold metallo-hydrolase [Thermoanaerobaculia bacterium]
MKSRAVALLAALLSVATVGARADDGAALEQVRPGVWAALQPEPLRFEDSNSIVIVSDTDVVVVDSQANPATSRTLIDRIRDLTDKPVRYLINTHFHSDHTRANFVYRDAFPGLEIVGHPTLIEDIPARSASDLEQEIELYRREIPAGEERLARGVDRAGGALDEAGKATLADQIRSARNFLGELEAVRWETPSLDPGDGMTLHRTVGSIEIRPVHAHTRGDLIVHLPDAGVLVTGDVLDDLPFGGHGYPGDWIDVLTRLEGLEWDLLIPGHGRLRRGEEARAHLARVRALFELMLSSAQNAVASELDLDAASIEFLESQALEPFRTDLVAGDPVAARAFDDFVPAGFERAFLEVSGRLPD